MDFDCICFKGENFKFLEDGYVKRLISGCIEYIVIRLQGRILKVN